MSALRLGRSAISSARRLKSFSRSASRSRKVPTELARSSLRLRRTLVATVRCTISNDTAVSPADVSSMAIRNFVRSRHLLIACSSILLADKLVACTMDGTKMYRIGGVFFQFLSETQDVRIDGASGGIVVIAPHFVQQLGARDHPLRIIQKETQRLELLGRQGDELPIAMQLHSGEIHFNVIEIEYFHLVGSLIQPPHRSPHA